MRFVKRDLFYKRSINVAAAFPFRRDGLGRGRCRFCRRILTGPRTRRWCSQDCVNQALVRCHPSFARQKVRHRDKGVCAVCGLDTRALKRAYKAAYQAVPYPEQTAPRWSPETGWAPVNVPDYTGWRLETAAIRDRLRMLGFEPNRSYWEMDHIIPVVEGGGFCGLDGLRTLCVPCHKRATAALAARRAAKASRAMERFWSKVAKSDGCWLWTAARNEQGYGEFSLDGKLQRAHRVSFYLAHGRWPEPNALHKCDNPPCVRPDHLFEGTHKENMADMTSKGRSVRGRSRPTSVREAIRSSMKRSPAVAASLKKAWAARTKRT